MATATARHLFLSCVCRHVSLLPMCLLSSSSLPLRPALLTIIAGSSLSRRLRCHRAWYPSTFARCILHTALSASLLCLVFVFSLFVFCTLRSASSA
ncbi:hypothetical protein HN51_012595 [Arachis hypogaea]